MTSDDLYEYSRTSEIQTSDNQINRLSERQRNIAISTGASSHFFLVELQQNGKRVTIRRSLIWGRIIDQGIILAGVAQEFGLGKSTGAPLNGPLVMDKAEILLVI